MSARIASAFLAALLGVACSGEVDPLEEAIEVRDLDLERLFVERPPGTLNPLRINAGERLQFSLRGENSAGVAIDDVPGEGRAWRVSDPSFATIDANGELLALADGAFTVDVRIGDVAASPVDVEVLTRPVGSIERIEGLDAIDPCVVERYVAIGGFGGSGESVDERLLSSAGWSVEGAGAERRPQDDGSVLLSVSRPGTVTLVASFNEARGDKEIVVNAAPTSLTVGPVNALTSAVGATTDLVATAVYAGEGDATREEVVTDSVDWEVVSGAEFVTIGNDPLDPETRGQVTALRDGGSGADGTASIRAVCGDVRSEARDFVVRASSTSGSSSGDDRELSFENAVNARGNGDGGELEVLVTDEPVQLRVSFGASYDEDDDVTRGSDTRWSLVNADDSVVGTVSTGGRFIPNTTGTTGIVDVRVVVGTRTATLRINVVAIRTR